MHRLKDFCASVCKMESLIEGRTLITHSMRTPGNVVHSATQNSMLTMFAVQTVNITSDDFSGHNDCKIRLSFGDEKALIFKYTGMTSEPFVRRIHVSEGEQVRVSASVQNYLTVYGFTECASSCPQ